MKKTLYYWQTVGFIFVSIMGVLLHFLYDWTGQSMIAATFAPVNESIWEHIKLIFFPMFIFAFAENRYIGKEYENFWCIKLIGIVLGVLLIPILYYTVNGAFGTTPDIVNIFIFFIVAAIVFFAEIKLFKHSSINCISQRTSLVILWLIALAFAVLTFVAPHIPLFEDPITKTYGYIE